mmetsp:Transcript_19352/g.32540  ORF Transcript_19352/g.32540 Transcript_19352/m.32540 type:complete len:250 (+) Transcript_19352:83-832(+)
MNTTHYDKIRVNSYLQVICANKLGNISTRNRPCGLITQHQKLLRRGSTSSSLHLLQVVVLREVLVVEPHHHVEGSRGNIHHSSDVSVRIKGGPGLQNIPHLLVVESFSLQSVQVISHRSGSVVGRKGMLVQVIVGDAHPEVLLHIPARTLDLLFHIVGVHHALAVASQHGPLVLLHSAQDVVHRVHDLGVGQRVLGGGVRVLSLEDIARVLLGSADTRTKRHLQQVQSKVTSLAARVHRISKLARLHGM